MPLKNTVAVERRMDLASLFCMIGRHGPAVALAVIAMVSVLAGFIIYRSVRGKRRKATAADGDGKSRREKRDASVIQPSSEDSSGESTDVNDDSSSDVKVDPDLSQPDLRHRAAAAAAAAASAASAAAAEKNPPPEVDIRAPEKWHSTSDERGVVWDYSYRQTYAEEASRGLLSDTCAAVAEVVVESATDDRAEDVMEEFSDDNDGCLKEPELMDDEKVLTAERQEDKEMMDTDVSDKKTNTRQEEENLRCASNNPTCLEEKSEDDRLEDNKATLETNGESNLGASVICAGDLPAPCISYIKDFEVEHPEGIDGAHTSPSPELNKAEEECGGVAGEVIEEVVGEDHSNKLTAVKSNEEEVDVRGHQEAAVLSDGATQGEVMEELLICDNAVSSHEEGGSSNAALHHDKGLLSISVHVKAQISDVGDSSDLSSGCPQKEDDIAPSMEEAQQDGFQSSTSEPDANLPSEDQCDHAVGEESLVIRDSDLDGDEGLCEEAVEEVTVITADTLLPQFNEEQVEIKQRDEVGLDQEDGDFNASADQAKEKMLPGDNTVASSEEDGSSVALPGLSDPVEVHSHNSSLSSINTDAKAHISEVGYSSDLSSGSQPLKEDELDPSLDVYKTEDNSVIVQQDDIWPSTLEQETSCPSTQLDSYHHVADERMPPLQDTSEGDSLATQVIEYNKPATTTTDTHSPEIIEQEVETEEKEEHCYSQENDMATDVKAQPEEDKVAPSLGEDTVATIPGPQEPSHEADLPENDKNGETIVLAEECSDKIQDLHSQSWPDKNQQSVQTTNNEDMWDVAAYPDKRDTSTASLLVEEISCLQPPSIRQDTSDETRAKSVACNDANPAALIMSTEISYPDMQSSHGRQSNLMENNEHLSQVTTTADPVTNRDVSLPMCQIDLPAFHQSECRDMDVSSPGVGGESGISSMAVSPDLQDAGSEFDVTMGNAALPVVHCDQTEAQNSLFADDVTLSVINENTAGVVSLGSQTPDSVPKYWTESFAANEDMLGHEIEDSYHRAMDEFAANIAVGVTTNTSELTMQTDMKPVIEVVEVREKKTGVSVEKKVVTKAEEEKEEDYERTEISIMEATMDHNEWITESNYPVLPWLNASASSFAQDHKKTNQFSAEECQPTSPDADATCLDTTDMSTSIEVKHTSALPIVDENTENNKKVVAVQPMPQTVNVTFCVHYFTQSPYQTVAVTGNQQELGNWKGFIPLERAKDGNWATVVSLPAESHVEWKFVVLEKGEVCRWEECGNRLLDTGLGDDLLVHKWWGLL